MKSILLLDDDDDFRSLVAAVLRAATLEVIEADDAAAAETTLSRITVDLVVVDGLLPDVHGIAFIEKLRAHNSTVRIVFVSALWCNRQDFERLIKELDVSLVIYKPIAAKAFAHELLRLLDQPKVAPSSTRPSNLIAELQALRARFAAKLPEKLRELGASVTRAKTDPQSIAEAQLLAHRMRGSAGSYGYPELGEAMGFAEDLLAEAAANPLAPRRYLWEQLDNALRDSYLYTERGPERLPEAAAGKHKALLVVDNDPDFLQFVRTVSRNLLLNVVTAQSAVEALQRARSAQLAGAVIDMNLRDGNGLSLARAIRSTEANPEIPIAFASAEHGIESLVAAIEAGGTRFFEKPMSAETFASLAQQLVTMSDATEGRVLIVDDDPEVTEHYTIHLRNAGITVDSLGSAEGIIEKLAQLNPDVLVLDIDLPGLSGLDVCRALRMSERFEALPILIVTALKDDRTRLLAFRAGASDVVTKPAIPEELLARVGVQLKSVRLQRDRADKDALSGLLLRRPFVEAFGRTLAAATREGTPLSMVLLDIDRFKTINDTYGHLAGDQVIARLGDLLRRRFRLEDLRSRWGGDEFMLVFPGQNIAFAERAAQRLLGEFSELRFLADNGEFFSATFTAGVAAYPQDGSTIAALVHRADERLYVGKQRGCSQVLPQRVPLFQHITPGYPGRTP